MSFVADTTSTHSAMVSTLTLMYLRKQPKEYITLGNFVDTATALEKALVNVEQLADAMIGSTP